MLMANYNQGSGMVKVLYVPLVVWMLAKLKVQVP